MRIKRIANISKGTRKNPTQEVMGDGGRIYALEGMKPVSSATIYHHSSYGKDPWLHR